MAQHKDSERVRLMKKAIAAMEDANSSRHFNGAEYPLELESDHIMDAMQALLSKIQEADATRAANKGGK